MLEEINVRLVVVVFDQIWRFVETNPAQIAGSIYVPCAGNVLGLFTIFVCHGVLFTDFLYPRQVFHLMRSKFFYGVAVGISLGSTFCSPGGVIGLGDGVGISSGVNIVPLFVCNTPPESITSSTR